MSTKKCGHSECGLVKPVKEFSKHAKTKDGLQSYCKSCQYKHKAKWQRENPLSVRKYLIKNKYGITPQQYEEILDAQNDKCAICKRPKDKPHFDIDHCHNDDCSEVRGLLCGRCNKALGLFRDDLGTIMSACIYLLKHQAKHRRKLGIAIPAAV